MHWTQGLAVLVWDLAGHWIVFLDKTLYSHSAPLHLGVETGIGVLSGKPNEIQVGGGGGGNLGMDWYLAQGKPLHTLRSKIRVGHCVTILDT